MEEEGRGEGSWCAIGRRAAMGGGQTRPPMIAAPMAPRGPRGRLQWCRNVSGAATIAPVLSVLLVTFPFFALVLCGYLATRGGALPASAIGGLNSFVLYFALPAMLYRFGAQTPIAQLLDPAVAGVYLLWQLRPPHGPAGAERVEVAGVGLVLEREPLREPVERERRLH